MQCSHVRLTGALLGLDKPGAAVNADDQAARDLGVERPGVARLLAAQNAAQPRDNLVRGRVGGLVEVDDAVPNVLLELALQRRAAVRKRRVVARAHIELIEILHRREIM